MLSIIKGLPGRLPVLSPWAWARLLLLLTMAYLVLVLHLDQRLYFSIKTAWQQSEQQEHGLRLAHYRVAIDAKPVAGVSGNLSGLTYDEQREQFWAVVNNPEELLALSKDGELLGRYPLSGFSDVEGVTYLGDDLLLLVEERAQTLVLVAVPERPGSLSRAGAKVLTLGIPSGENQGFEGLGYDRSGDRLFVVKEHSPRKLYEIRGLKSSMQGHFNLQVIDRDKWLADKDFAADLSSVEYDPVSGHLLLLSDESKLLMELDNAGSMVSLLSLFSTFAGLDSSVPQAEGVSLDAQGNLYLVSEPNLFYQFVRQ